MLFSLNPASTHTRLISRITHCACTFLLISLAGCGGGGGGDDTNTPPPTDTSTSGGEKQTPTTSPKMLASCDLLTWESYQAAPLKTLEISGLDDNLLALVQNSQTVLNAEIYVNDEHKGDMPVEITEGTGAIALRIGMPPYPAAPYQGGNIDIALAFGSEACPSETVTVSALSEPESPRAVIDDSIGALEDALLTNAAMYGFSDVQQLLELKTVLENGSRSLSMPEILLLSAAESLEVTRAVTASGALAPEDEKLLAAMLEQIGTLGFSAGMTQMLNSLPGVPTIDPATLPPATLIDTDTGSYVRIQSAGGSGACGAAIMGDPMEITSAFDLDLYMQQQKEAEESADSLGNDALDLLGLSLPAVGVVFGPAGAAAGTGAGAMIYVYKLIQDITINTLPSRFNRIELSYSPQTPPYPEDYLEGGNPAPRWDSAMATVSSKGMNLTGQAIDAMLQLFGAANWAGSVGNAQGFFDSVRGAAGDAGLGESVNLLKDQLGDDSIDCFKVASWTWSGIDIASDEYTTASVPFGNSIAITKSGGDQNKQTINFQRTGSSTIKLETRSDKFGGRKGEASSVVNIERITLDPDPSMYWVDQIGETKSFTVNVLPGNAEVPEKPLQAEIIKGGGSLPNGIQPSGGNQHILDVTTPADEELYPVEVKVTRQASLPDESGSTARTTTIDIRNDEIVELTPESRCIGRGEELTLTATLRGKKSLASGELNWNVISGGGSISPGAISGLTQQGTYTAPNSLTEAAVEVSFTDRKGKEKTDISYISVGSCDAQLFIDGSFTVGAHAGSEYYDYDSEDDYPLPDLPNPPSPAVMPPESEKWQGRSYVFTGSGNVTGEETVDCASPNEQNGTCYDTIEANIQADAFGSNMIASDADGNITYSHEYQGNDQCLPVNTEYLPESYDPACSSSDSVGFYNIRYYLNIEAATTRQLEIEFACQETTHGLGFGIAYVFGSRLAAGGDPEQDQGPLESQSSFLNLTPEEMMEYIERRNREQRGQNVVLSCDSASPSHTLTYTFEIPGPADPDKADRGLIQIGFASVGMMPQGWNKEDIRQAIEESYSVGGAGSIPAMEEQQPGKFNGSVVIDGRISLKTVE